jgi:hypothetical protein
MLARFWNWISDEKRQKTLGFLGADLAAVFAATWQTYKYFDEKQPKLVVSAPVTADKKSLDCDSFSPGPIIGRTTTVVESNGDIVQRTSTEVVQGFLDKYPNKEKSLLELTLVNMLCKVVEQSNLPIEEKIQQFHKFQRAILENQLRTDSKQ